ncbi:hypothetical protein MHU86_2511 [Fragilaria crotonensis]|nr:hypothetical protein MHU86_2511 [Fragilaria crotonensis]
MHHYIKSIALASILLAAGTDAFATPNRLAFRHANMVRATSTTKSMMMPAVSSSSTTRLFASSTNNNEDGAENEVERLRAMAARLRAEAAALEAQKAQQVADATERAFKRSLILIKMEW